MLTLIVLVLGIVGLIVVGAFILAGSDDSMPMIVTTNALQGLGQGIVFLLGLIVEVLNSSRS